VSTPGDRLTWLGHATVLLELAGVRLITDPVLRPRVGHLWRRPAPPPPPGRLDAVLVSHLHRDHLDLPSLRALEPGALVVVPRGAARVVRRLPHAVAELGAGEELRVGAALVRAVPAVHDGRRSPLGGGVGEAIGFMVEAGPRVYFAGDTERYDAMAELAPCDVALLPVWGWGPTLGPGHMDPEQAAAAAALVRPAIAVPIHWGTFAPGVRRSRELLPDAPARRFETRCAQVAPDTRVHVLEPGGSLALA
jgi:L-ascorbate metabolism protein UlaG (beta-lactamase superfamily)